MKKRILEAVAELKILKPVEEVFKSIVDPAVMSKYFISESSGRLEDGKTVMWKFPEFDFEFPVKGGRIEKDRYISFYWENNGIELMVEINLIPRDDNSTIVRIREAGMNDDEAGIKWLTGNTAGWANFLACLKAWLEYGINLRKGAFDHMAGN